MVSETFLLTGFAIVALKLDTIDITSNTKKGL